MTSTDLLITPGPNGKRHWQEPYFSLVPKRAYAYEIPKRFENPSTSKIGLI